VNAGLPLLERARAAAEAVEDPELVDVTIGDLGLVRDVRQEGSTVIVELTPTYTACPAFEVIRDDVLEALNVAGIEYAAVVRRLSPPWSSDWVTERGRAALQASGVAAPRERASGPIGVQILRAPVHARSESAECPVCGSDRTEVTSWYGSSACKSLCHCLACDETFESFKTVEESRL
jgi:ring-1,2-phenylacetyl-CoA epoxidase subunit PaaD